MSQNEMGAPPATAGSRFGNFRRTLLTVLIAVLIFFAGGAAALVGERILFAGGNEVRVLTFQDWRVVCPPRSEADNNCTLSQDVVREQGGVLVTLNLSDPTLGSRLAVTVPHGVLLDPGLGFSVGDQPLQVHPYETCTQIGCLTLVTLDTAMLDLLRSNMNGQIVVVPGDGSPVTIPFSLNGFGDGYAALIQERARRNSVWGFLSR